MSRTSTCALWFLTLSLIRSPSLASLRTSSRRLISTTRPLSSSANKVIGNHENLFRFTRGRFIGNEAQELAQRYMKFNVEELAKLAERAAAAEAPGNRPRRRKCIRIEKLADGMHNKALRFTMDSGVQVLGKVPNPNAGLKYFTTVSEVATMDFMRYFLRTPVPKVFDWSFLTDNPVGTEYILMEHARGVSLSTIWDRLDVNVQFKAWSEVSFMQYGSLYYSKDLSRPTTALHYTKQDGESTVDDWFAVGPSVCQKNLENGRGDMGFYRGPWSTVEDYERATGHREAYCVKNLPYLPHTSHIWHDDIHTEDVFVNPDDPAEITAFIDWQSTELAPLYNRVIQPYILDYDGPRLDDLLEQPKLAGIEALFQDEPEPVARRKTDSLFMKMSLIALYRFILFMRVPRLFKALKFRQTDSLQLLLLARNISIDGEATYLDLLAEQQEMNRAGIPRLANGKGKPPVSFSNHELQEIDQDAEAAARSMELMGDLRRMIGMQYFQADGMISHEQFKELEQILPNVRE
ncbi:hypothetical protein BDW69DRAFT_193970 [Aspergillus filifer]